MTMSSQSSNVAVQGSVLSEWVHTPFSFCLNLLELRWFYLSCSSNLARSPAFFVCHTLPSPLLISIRNTVTLVFFFYVLSVLLWLIFSFLLFLCPFSYPQPSHLSSASIICHTHPFIPHIIPSFVPSSSSFCWCPHSVSLFVVDFFDVLLTTISNFASSLHNFLNLYHLPQMKPLSSKTTLILKLLLLTLSLLHYIGTYPNTNLTPSIQPQLYIGTLVKHPQLNNPTSLKVA